MELLLPKLEGRSCRCGCGLTWRCMPGSPQLFASEFCEASVTEGGIGRVMAKRKQTTEEGVPERAAAELNRPAVSEKPRSVSKSKAVVSEKIQTVSVSQPITVDEIRMRAERAGQEVYRSEILAAWQGAHKAGDRATELALLEDYVEFLRKSVSTAAARSLLA